MIHPVSLSLFCAAACLAPALALAQPAAGTVFVEGGAYADIRRAPSTSATLFGGDDGSGTVAGGTLGIGVHLTPRISVRGEWSMTGTLSIDRDASILPYTAEDLVLSGLPLSLLAPQQITEERDVKAGFALLGYHFAAGRTSIELLGGVGLVNERVGTIAELQLPFLSGLPGLPGLPSLPVGPDYRTEYSQSAHHAVAVLGAGAAVSLAGHAALVPQVRVYVLNGALQVRPGLNLRWTF
jgi:hypothetical protein